MYKRERDMPDTQNRRRKDSKNFLVQGSILAVASILVRIIGLIYRIPMTRLIGKEGMGYYDYAFEVYNFCFIISSYGMPMAVSKLVAGYTAKKEYKSAFKTFIGGLIVATVIGLTLCLLVYFGADVIATRLLANSAIAIPLKVVAPTILICSLLGVVRGFFQGKGTMVPTAMSQLVEQIVNAIVSVAAAYALEVSHSASKNIAAFGAKGGVTGTLVGGIFGLALLVFIFVINLPMFSRQMRNDEHADEGMTDLIKLLLVTVIPVMLSQILTRSNGLIAIALYNNVMAGKGVSSEDYTSMYGIYSSMYLVLENIIIGITSAITMAMIPSIVSANEAGTFEEVEHKANMCLKFNLMIAIPASFGLAVVGAPVIRLLFGENEPVVKNVMLIGASAALLYTLSVLFNTIIQSIYKMMLPVRNSAIAIIIDVVALFIMLKFLNMGIYALVIGNLILPAVVIILDGKILVKTLGMRFELRTSVIIPLISSIIMSIVVALTYFLIDALTGQYAIGVIASILLGMFVYFVCEIKLRGVTEHELISTPKGQFIVNFAKRLKLM